MHMTFLIAIYEYTDIQRLDFFDWSIHSISSRKLKDR